MLTTLTEQDVHAAMYAFETRRLAVAEKTSAEDIIRDFADSATIWRHNLARYERGAALLRDYIVIYSDRSTVGGQFDADTAERIVSPVIEVESGYIAYSITYRAVALAQR